MMTVYNFQQATFLALGKKPLRLLAKHWRGYTKDKNFVFIDVFIDIYYLLLVFTLAESKVTLAESNQSRCACLP